MSFFDSLPASRLSGMNRHLVQKSCGDNYGVTPQTFPNLLKQPMDSEAIIDLFVDESKLLQDVSVRRVNNRSGKVHFMDYCEIATQGSATTSCPPGSKPADYTRDYFTQKYRAHLFFDSDMLEDNVEGQGFRNTLMNMFSRKLRSELELAAIQGDSTLTTGDSQTAINNLLGVNDGWDKILEDCAPSCQVIDAAGKAPSKFLYYYMMEKLPNRYHMNSDSYRFVGPRQMVTRWGLDVTSRETSLGDSALGGGDPNAPFGVPFYWVPQWRFYQHMGNDGAYTIWYTPLDNLYLYIQRDMTTEVIRRPEHDGWDVYVHYRVDFEVANPDAVVIATNVRNCGNPFAECDCTGACPAC